MSLLLSACATGVPELTRLDRIQTDNLADQDQDGVINQRDLCASSPAGMVLDEQGCTRSVTSAPQRLFAVEFDLDQAIVRDDQKKSIAAAIADAKADARAEVLVVGDTSPEGSDQYNRDLAKRRADALFELLIAGGVEAGRIGQWVSTDSLVRPHLKSRERRTLILVRHAEASHPQSAWHIYQTEDRISMAQGGVK
ncbi:OmpA family protein [Chitinibacter sp. SCUT-21]|uniref:OmpA family protein n=1 Tax=Chitinibacter sp. SCUT-21 TaxID=2970891 RepID=UPI0035A65C35